VSQEISEPEFSEEGPPRLRAKEIAGIHRVEIWWDRDYQAWLVEPKFLHEDFLAPGRAAEISYVWLPDLASVATFLGVSVTEQHT